MRCRAKREARPSFIHEPVLMSWLSMKVYVSEVANQERNEGLDKARKSGVDKGRRV